MTTIRVSAGSAAVIGLNDIRLAAAPTTAYLMSGEGCVHDCAFCTQARSAQATRGALSRVTWPEYDLDAVVTSLKTDAPGQPGPVGRVCLQVVHDRDWRQEVAGVLRQLPHAGLPVSVSVHLAKPEDALALADLGVDRVGIPLDAATPALYAEIKGQLWEPSYQALLRAAELLPGRVSTHLIVGLGETEEEIIRLIGDLTGHGITVGLFAFTPVRGTRLADRSAPLLAAYRRVQAAHYLLRRGLVGVADLAFTANGELSGFGLAPMAVRDILSGGVEGDEPGAAFRTTGCPDCNRPYYNERVGREPYNYPRSLTESELGRCLATLGLDVRA
jgi:biotin synthase